MTTLALETPTLAPALIPTIASRKHTPPAKRAQQPVKSLTSVAPPRTYEEISDEEVIQAISQGEEWAVEVLYTRYHRYAYALAYRILEDGTAAEDIVQEVYLSIWRKAASYQRQYGSVHSWLQAIVHNRAVDCVRSAAYREQRWKSLQGDEREQEPVCEQPDGWKEVWERERRQLILQALAELPVEQRRVIEESYFEGYTHFEIAQRWNLPLGTVKGRMRLGLQKIRHFLEEHGLTADL
ncbi:MAG TPA: sigma-70 family RNA polymerase sigma factor [Ktedonobacteraceae bacterium]|nr:sigma-70 family RNA polymerase sigma factor [Ktedonobacteraceae bacterium]